MRLKRRRLAGVEALAQLAAATNSAEPAIVVVRLANVPMPSGTSSESPRAIATAPGSTPSASATICASVVSWPWPWGPAPGGR